VEFAGYGFRIASVGNVTNQNLYVIQFLFVMLAPVFTAGIVYVVFGRIVFHVVPARARSTKLLWIPRESLTRVDTIP
jgi:hypothetical protein